MLGMLRNSSEITDGTLIPEYTRMREVWEPGPTHFHYSPSREAQ